MKKGKNSDYDLNMNDYSQMYDYNLITLRLITQLLGLVLIKMSHNESK